MQAGRQADKQADRQTSKPAGKHAGGQTIRHADKQAAIQVCRLENTQADTASSTQRWIQEAIQPGRHVGSQETTIS